MRRFFYASSHQLSVGKTLALTDTIFSHWCKVLRAQVGDSALLFDGSGGEYTATLCQLDKKSAHVHIDDFNPINRSLPFEVDIGLVMSRGERMDYALQKACELGVTRIHLLTSQHGEVRLKPDQVAKKLAHWQGVVISACEQCGLNRVPMVLAPMSIDDWVLQVSAIVVRLQQLGFDRTDLSKKMRDDTAMVKLVLAVPNEPLVNTINSQSHENKDKIAWHCIQQALQPPNFSNFCLLIGAEGGLSTEEVRHAVEQGFLPWQIGERVLRTETAPVVALSALQTVLSLSM